MHLQLKSKAQQEQSSTRSIVPSISIALTKAIGRLVVGNRGDRGFLIVPRGTEVFRHSEPFRLILYWNQFPPSGSSCIGNEFGLNFRTKRRMLGSADEFVRLSCRGNDHPIDGGPEPAGGEMSGLTAHFLFGANFSRKTAADFDREPLDKGANGRASMHGSSKAGRDSESSRAGGRIPWLGCGGFGARWAS